MSDQDGPKITYREAIIADNHAALTGRCTHCGDEHTTAQHKAHGKGSFRRQHPGYFKRWNVKHTINGGKAEDVSQVSGANEEAAREIAGKVLPKGSKILSIKYAGTVDGLPIPAAPPMKSHFARVEVGTRRIAEGKGKGKILGPKTSAKKTRAAKRAGAAKKAVAKKPSVAKKMAPSKKAVAKKMAPKLTPAVKEKIRAEAIAEERDRCNKARRSRKPSGKKAPKASGKLTPAKVQAIAKAAVKAEEKVIVKEVAKAVQAAGGESGGLMGSGAVAGIPIARMKPKADRDAAKKARGERTRFSPADIKGLAAELAAATKRPAKKPAATKKPATPKPKPNGKGKAKAKKAAKKKAGKK